MKIPQHIIELSRALETYINEMAQYEYYVSQPHAMLRHEAGAAARVERAWVALKLAICLSATSLDE